MTEGIIQKAFKKLYTHTIWYDDIAESVVTREQIDLALEELIEEIREECFDIEFKTYEYESIIKVKQLIGDSK